MCAPLNKATEGGKRYFLMMTTTPHSYTVTELLSSRDEAVGFLLDHILWLVRNLESKVKRVYCDHTKQFTAIKKT